MKKNVIFVLIPVLLCFILFFLNFNKGKDKFSEISLKENPEIESSLEKIILQSKYEPDKAILSLNELQTADDYSSYKAKYILGKLYEDKNDLNSALAVYLSLADKKCPLHERVLFHLGDVYSKLQDDKQAIKCFLDLIKTYRDSRSVIQAKYKLAQAYSRLRLVKKSQEIFKSLSEDYSDTQYGIASRFYLGEQNLNLGNVGEAQENFRSYLESSPDGRFASEIVDKFLKGTISPGQKDFTLIGDYLYKSGKFKDASLYYSRGNDPRKYYELGYSLFRAGMKKEAKEFLTRYAVNADPKDVKTRFALYYTALCIPERDVKHFWSKFGKENPDLEYYTLYKLAQAEESPRKGESILKDLLARYPATLFSLDAVWDLMWAALQDKNYNLAFSIGKKYFDLSKNTEYKNSDSRAKIGYYLGKISEVVGNLDQAKAYYKESGDLIFDDYYSFKSRFRLKDLNNSTKTDIWKLTYTPYDYSDFKWDLSKYINYDDISSSYGDIVSDLLKLKQFEEAIDVIGTTISDNKQTAVLLKSLNKNHMESINLASTEIKENNLEKGDQLLYFSYPLYYWIPVYLNSKNYPKFDPLFAFSLIRQESRFEANAYSVSDARGLMQLIPPTARAVASKLGITLSSLDSLKDPTVNTALGIDYINGLINMFPSPVFAVAGYNAGPGASQRWIKKFGIEDYDFFIEQIPYTETRDYVKKVYSNYWTYKELYKN